MDNPALKVLLVEDDEDDYVLTRDLLSKFDHPAVALNWVTNYRDALEAIERNEHDVYLVDYSLGAHDGVELLRQAHSSTFFSKPIIMLTGQEMGEIDTQAIQAGAADYLLKSQVNSSLLKRSIRHALERAKTLEKLHKLASYDELTGLYNRRGMDCLLKEEVSRYRRYGRAVALVMVDVDNFKTINDTYGHYMGDEVLRWLGKTVRETVREVDLAARYGGEEFAIILPEMAGQQAFEMAERLRRTIAARPFICTGNNRQTLMFPVSVSLGVASLPEDAEMAEALMVAADKALYEAKQRGRNQTVRSANLQARY